MGNYYAESLNAQSLFRVYDTAIPRIRQYLGSEIDFVRQRLSGTERVLEMAAGYGRIMKELAPHCGTVLGMDISAQNVELGKEYLKDYSNASMVEMDAYAMTFTETFDVVLCLQNALSAMKADFALVQKIISLLAPGGAVYFSSYNPKFWDWRVKWFEEQAAKGLLGKLDYEQTKDGVIVCEDGFRSVTHTASALKEIGEKTGLPYEVKEVDDSSIFLVVQQKNKKRL